MMMKTRSGFTLIEMMVVLAISLVLMVMVVPIFQVTTRTVQTVERKLAIYEAARNILDTLEYQVHMAVYNERGNTFTIKSACYTDNDPNDRCSPPGTSSPATGQWSPLGYRQSRREGDGMTYVMMQGGGFRWADNLIQPASQAFALSYPEAFLNTPEAWKTSVRSSLHYPNTGDSLDRYYSDSRAQQLLDTSRIKCEVVNTARTAEFLSGSVHAMYDPVYNDLMPGSEQKIIGFNQPFDPDGESKGAPGTDIHFSLFRTLGAINLMDLDIAYWDARAREFKDPPDNTLLSLAPAPRAIRITITVCDRDRRGTATLCRIIQLTSQGLCDDETSPGAGAGSAQITRSALDTTRLDKDLMPFNRPKNLKILEPNMFN